jgi:hypothetical protein
VSEYRTKRFAFVDAAILDALNGRSITFSALTVIPNVASEADKASRPDRYGNSTGWRLVDRRLQAMRKAGLVKVSRATGWARA